MLGVIKDDTEVGFYNSAVKVKNILVSIVASLGTVLLPRASFYIQNNQKEEFYNISKKSINFTILISFPLSLFFIFLAKECVMLVSGDKFINSIFPMQILLPCIIFIGLTNILGNQILVPLGKEKKVLISIICGAVIDLVINIILIPIYGCIGAAIGTLLAELLVFIIQFVFIPKNIKYLFKKISYWKIIIAAILPIFAVTYFKSIRNYFF